MNSSGRSVGGAHPTTTTTCRLIIDEPATGAWNMAVDEALLVDAAENGTATLRFYGWSTPTLSLGYFQRYADRERHAASRNCEIVRRQTGGGAILHDRELTYSLTLPERQPLALQAGRLYATVHKLFIDVLAELNPHSASSCTMQIRENCAERCTGEEPFLCFQRQSPGDGIMASSSDDRTPAAALQINSPRQTWKVLGSAQRRYHRAVLQHGSLLLNLSPAAPELPGWSDLSDLIVDSDELAATIAARLGDKLCLQLIESFLSPELKSKSTELANNKYGTPGWTKRR